MHLKIDLYTLIEQSVHYYVLLTLIEHSCIAKVHATENDFQNNLELEHRIWSIIQKDIILNGMMQRII